MSDKRDHQQEQGWAQYKVVSEGPPDGPVPGPKSICTVRYRGSLIDGTLIESNMKRGNPTRYLPSKVMPGWSEALQMMKEGDEWELYIPSELGYGDNQKIKAPPGQVLIYTVQLLKVRERETVEGLNHLTSLMAGALLCFLAWRHRDSIKALFAPGKKEVLLEDVSGKPDNAIVYFDVEINGKAVGRNEMELFTSTYPLTCENFRCLCTGEKGVGEAKRPLHYKGSYFHRIIPQFMCQGGDFTLGDGRGGESIYGRTFNDEWDNGMIRHTKGGLLSMANSGPNTNGSQFFITLKKTSWLDGNHVVFGQVTDGVHIVQEMEANGTGSGKPKAEIQIKDCGQLPARKSKSN
eukprot:CAMPEP_0202827236 /NCGR_PEP_ID=MMETSP1389-20130828/14132_1 /ASSEMBLY_ACC=CAM_ASM_000865 /TAXON_ID=302021 /ORGANISM="Rhodomonas sp., Strain CCMP768" /LENGTH=348 /DNA_ID=CAMNT_0049500611 /DNA_START=12 /DNA_END=1058 /DNA_ORIENTATION=-